MRSGGIFDYDAKRERLEEVERELENPDIWNDPETLAVMRPDEPRVFSTYVREFTLVCEERVLRDLTRSVFMFTQVTHSRP